MAKVNLVVANTAHSVAKLLGHHANEMMTMHSTCTHTCPVNNNNTTDVGGYTYQALRG